MWILYLLVGIVLLVGLCLLVFAMLGRRLPAEHRMVCVMPLKGATADQVWDTINDVQNWPEWAGVDSVEILKGGGGGEPQWRMKMGRNTMLCQNRAARRPHTLEVHVEDERAKIFTGVWRYDIRDDGAQVRITLTEDGAIHMAIPRYMARRLADPAMYLKRHLRHLAKRFGQEARIEDVKG